ncbi:Uncharacterised protein [Mycobacteroides abscessus subsp. massiliense]|nr:Uncharacterised protein [Mycobacteroides abscessus subsp. massiliense]
MYLPKPGALTEKSALNLLINQTAYFVNDTYLFTMA